MKGLKQRAITALIFGIVIIGTILLNRYACIGLLALIAGGTALEYGLVVKKSHAMLLGLVAISMVGILVYSDQIFIHWVIVGLTIVTMTILASYVFRKSNDLNHSRWAYWVAAFYFGSSMGLFATEIKVIDDYSYYFIGVLVLIWLSDSGAYIVGSQWGKRKLMPKISPNKTVEGFLGSLASVLIGGYILSKLTPVETTDWWIIISIVVWLAGTLGDLTQSAIKRQYGVKDTGRLLPGHGGVWDRFDSLLYVAPAVALVDRFLI
jgi:phosphatidate cytidylyltransferase